ncbi:MAG: hypothetical protein NT036_02370 [Candidatus Omnitrophica bacterium]|nr:hypothetical protein [Candidatus Omnitrophota bacterium]
MITLNFAMIMMMIGSNMMPMHIENMYTPTVYPAPQVRVINEVAAPAAPIGKEAAPALINQHKTYEQTMKEAFERIYAEVNRLLDQIPDQTDEQFQLHRMM